MNFKTQFIFTLISLFSTRLRFTCVKIENLREAKKSWKKKSHHVKMLMSRVDRRLVAKLENHHLDLLQMKFEAANIQFRDENSFLFRLSWLTMKNCKIENVENAWNVRKSSFKIHHTSELSSCSSWRRNGRWRVTSGRENKKNFRE